MNNTQDPIVERVIKRMRERSEKGMVKYGNPLSRGDIDILGWINHAQEELMDAVNYLEALKNRMTDDGK